MNPKKRPDPYNIFILVVEVKQMKIHCSFHFILKSSEFFFSVIKEM